MELYNCGRLYSRCPLHAYAEEILHRHTVHGTLTPSIKLNISNQHAIANMYMFLSLSVWTYTSSMHQYRHIHNTRCLVKFRLYKTPVFWVGSIHIARSRYSVSSPAQRAVRYNSELIICFTIIKYDRRSVWSHSDPTTQAENQRCYISFNKDFGLNRNFQSLSVQLTWARRRSLFNFRALPFSSSDLNIFWRQTDSLEKYSYDRVFDAYLTGDCFFNELRNNTLQYTQ